MGSRLGRMLFWVALALLTIAGPARAAKVPWLYDVEVPVADQSASARARGTSDALLKLLTRITGLVHVPKTNQVASALENPNRYFSSFNFARDPEGRLRLNVSFVPRAVLGLLDRADLPVWGANRPAIMLWIAVDERRLGGERRVLGADDEDPLVAAIAARALDRGLEVRLPTMDLEDQTAVDAAAVWGRMSAVLEPASVRYDAELLVTGRVERVAGDRASSEWAYAYADRSDTTRAPSGTVERQGAHVIDWLADRLAEQFAVLGREPRRLSIQVVDIAGVADYAAVMRYLGRLEFVQDLSLDSIAGRTLSISFTSRSTDDQIVELLSIDGRLAPEATQISRASDALRFTWR